MSIDCRIEEVADGTVELNGELTFQTTPRLFENSTRLLGSAGGPTRLDLAGIYAVDSSGLALLLEWQSMRPSDDRLQIINAPKSLLSLAQLCEAVDLLNLSGRTGDP
jgi:ABC-type transporter Mla MlaB component